jgi:murein DD-endopeptidase MepM/ murein hydrolase activator NlpD
MRSFKRLAAFAAACCSVKNALAIPAGLLLAFLPLSSDPTSSGILPLPYAPRSAHQAYGFSLAHTHLAANALGRQWFTAAERALLEPERISTPFDTATSLAASTADALGYAFAVSDGQRVRLDAQLQSPDVRELFVELYRSTDQGLEYVTGALPVPPTGEVDLRPIELEVFEPAEYIVRIQPALAGVDREHDNTDYAVRVRILTSPLLAFPVGGFDTRAIQSGFGAERDGGRREHRGVDIFAPRGTPAVAATDGWVVRVESTRVGGNIVWLQPLFGNMRLYYAHLDHHYVERGQFVLAGEQIGTVGNTGNARTTPPHLHFGVYVRRPGVRGGARDPYGFLR